MNALRHWGYALCIASVVCCMIQMLAPKGKLQKMLHLVLSVFFLCCLLTPVLHGQQIHFLTDRTEAFADPGGAQQIALRIEERYRQLAEENLRSMITEKLREDGMEPLQIEFHTELQEDGTAEITSAEVVLSAEYKGEHTEIRRRLMDYLGINVLLGYI